MICQKDERWLKKALDDCFRSAGTRATKEKRLLEGFSLLVKHLTKNMETQLLAIRKSWEDDPASPRIKEKFDKLERSLSYLTRYCSEKIERKKT